MGKKRTQLAKLNFGVIQEKVTKSDYANYNELRDLLNGVLEHDDQIVISLAEDPDDLPADVRQATCGRVRNAIVNFELPYTERTGASKFRFVMIRLLETSFGKLLPVIGEKTASRCSALFSLIFFNYVTAYNVEAKRRINDLSDQGLLLNRSTFVAMQSYRNHYANGMSLTLKSVDELFLHPNYIKYLPEYTGTILFKEVFFKEGVISEFLNVHQNARSQTMEAIGWSDSLFNKPISTDGGNFVTCAGANTLSDFKGKKINSRERIVQLLPAVSIDTFSLLQTAFILVFQPKLFDIDTRQQIQESDTHETFLLADTRIGIAQTALVMCTKDVPSSKDGKSEQQSSTSPEQSSKGFGKGKGPKGKKSKGPKGDKLEDSSDNSEREEPEKTDSLGNPVHIRLDRYQDVEKPISRSEFANAGLVASVQMAIYSEKSLLQAALSAFRSYGMDFLKTSLYTCKPIFIPKLL